MKERMADRLEQVAVEGVQFLVFGLVGTSSQEHRNPDLAAIELAFVKEPRSRSGRHHHSGGALLRRRECGGGSRLIVILDEANKLRLIRRIGAEMAADALGIIVFQAVVQPLVVAVVEPLLLQLPFEIPVRFGDEEKRRG